MASINFATRFSDDTYATKIEVSKTLGTTLIDDIWQKIVTYRGQFSRDLGLRSIEKSPFKMVLTPMISDQIALVERKLTKAMMKYASLSKHDPSRRLLREKQLHDILQSVARHYNIDVNDEFIQQVIDGNISALNLENMVLVHYFEIIKHLESNHALPVNIDSIGKLYEKLNGNVALTSFYREKEITDPGQKALIDRIYAAAPLNRIADMMDDLVSYLEQSTSHMLVSAIASLFYIYYIKPFEYYSEDLSVLVMKAVLAQADLEEVAIILNLEQFLGEHHDMLTSIILEVKKTNDLTYLVTRLLPLLEHEVDQFLDRYVEVQKVAITNENYPLPPIASTQTPVEVEKPVEVVSAPVSQVKPIVVEPILEKAETPLPVAHELKVALPVLPIGLDEADAKKIEEHLMEIDPSLSRHEASFYARHCTIGKYYTISQFKQTIGCAYETARTSMDHLVEAGYYRKEQFKNKYIYTPISRR